MSDAEAKEPCRWCGETHGARCPWVAALEFFENGNVARVEFTKAGGGATVAAGEPDYARLPSKEW